MMRGKGWTLIRRDTPEEAEAKLRAVIRTRARFDIPKIPKLSFRGQNERLPSLQDTSVSVCARKEPKKYTGTNLVGIATMHKSNSVPVFSQNEAIDLAKMRR